LPGAGGGATVWGMRSALVVVLLAGCTSSRPHAVEESSLSYLDDEAVGVRAGARPRPARPAGQIDRGELEAALAVGPAPVLAEFELEADLVSGRFQGWRIKSAPGSTSRFAEVDLAKGDVVRSVNGRSLERPNDMYEVWESLHGAQELVIAVQRAGAMRTLRYRIVGEAVAPPAAEAPASPPGAGSARSVPAPREVR